MLKNKLWIMMNKILDGIWEGYKILSAWGVICLIFCIVLFGGDISIKITFHTAVDLWNTIIRTFK
jgi:hypothetical protein